MKLLYNDSSHSYWLDGKRVKSASKVAGIAADSFTIEQWQKRQVAIGMTLDRTLAERVAVDLDNREAIQQVCEDAANAAKANARAERGVQRHRVFELGLLGRQDQFITDQQVADWKVLERTLNAYGLTPITDRVEQFIAWPEHGVVGRYDCYLDHEGRAVLTDLKGGLNAVKYPHSTAVQTWLYRFAPFTSKAIKRDGDRSEVTEWTTAPDGADEEISYVLYCDDHHDVGELWRIDLTAARQGGHLSLGIVNWRKTKNYGRELAHQVAAPPPPEPAASTGEGLSLSPTPVDETRRNALLARYQAMNDTDRLAYTALNIDRNDLDAIAAALEQIDVFNVHTVYVPPEPPESPPLPSTPDEGATVADSDVQALRARFDALSDMAQLWTATLVAQGRSGHNWRITDTPTTRRYELYRGVIALAEWDDNGVDDIVTGLVREILPDHGPEAVLTPGEALGLLDADQATRFANLAHDLTKDRLAVSIDDDGTLRLTAAV